MFCERSAVVLRRQRYLRYLATVAAASGFAGAAAAEPSVGQFEIKSLSAEPGEIEFQSQNAYSTGQPKRRTATTPDGELIGDDNSVTRRRHALEMEVGFSRTLKGRIGIEYEQERSDTVSLEGSDFASLKLDEYAGEIIWVAVPREGDGFGLGFVVEYEHPAQSGGTRTLNAGPIFEFQNGPWLATLNPSLVQFFGGERNDAGNADAKIDFAYTARLMYAWSDDVSLALESYGTIERIGGSGSPGDEQAFFGDFNQHRAGPVVYWSWPLHGVPASSFRSSKDEAETPEAKIGLGALFGLNEQTPDATLKVSFEMTF